MAKEKKTPVVLLSASHLGAHGDVVDVDSADVAALKTDGLVDDAEAAVAYAASLKTSAE